MARPFEVVSVGFVRSVHELLEPDLFTYSPAKGWAWLQRLCFRFLRWRGCQHVSRTTKFKRHVINPSKFVEAIFAQQRSLTELLGRGGEVLLVGAEDYHRLMGELIESAGPVAFNADYRAGRNGRAVVLGLKIVIVPWMRGLIVIPPDVAAEISA